MAAKESNGTLSKSDAVRQYLSSHATAPVKEVASARFPNRALRLPSL